MWSKLTEWWYLHCNTLVNNFWQRTIEAWYMHHSSMHVFQSSKLDVLHLLHWQATCVHLSIANLPFRWLISRKLGSLTFKFTTTTTQMADVAEVLGWKSRFKVQWHFPWVLPPINSAECPMTFSMGTASHQPCRTAGHRQEIGRETKAIINQTWGIASSPGPWSSRWATGKGSSGISCKWIEWKYVVVVERGGRDVVNAWK